MSQILRVYRADVLTLVRNYSSQRLPNHYDALRISPNATQKEIKLAFIELSKKMHPDISGKKDHADFVKVNEAYSVLSKENSRRDYDMSLKYDRMHDHTVSGPYYNPYASPYSSRREWEEHMAGSRWASRNYKPSNQVPLSWILFFMIVGVGIQFMFIQYSIAFKREALWERSRKYAEEYHKVREQTMKRTTEERLEDIYEYMQNNKRKKGIDS